MDIDVPSMRTLLAVLDQGSMTAAARVLDVSQSAVSWKIKRLEERIGQPLLLRDGRTLRPSRACRSILRDARSVVELHDRMVANLTRAELSGAVRVGAHEDIGVRRLTDILASFRRVHPDAEVSFVLGGSGSTARLVDAGELDVGLIQVPESRARATDEVLWSEQPRWYTGGWSAHDEPPIAMISYHEDCEYRAMGVRQLEAAGIEYHNVAVIPSTEAVIRAVEQGLGVSVIAESFASDRLVEWPLAADLPPLPTMPPVVRTVPGESSDIAAALADLLVAELSSPPGRSLVPA